ncbi:NAD(P)-dependent oxidoreductase [Lentibacillus halophilus]|uniref:NAD(P)-dependent oxidoreductase n=1 Tax=Lentibacillus halophilus TaxID=295065 RepID=A0ABP3IYL2_9BACI
MKIGFIGLGSAGLGMVCNLAREGYQVTVNDLDRSKAEPALELGATWGETPAETAAGVDVLITSLPSSAAVNEVLTGDKGAFLTLSPGTIWMEMGTNIESEIIRLAEIASSQGVETIEAPVTGGIHLIDSGDVTILCGGKANILEHVRPLLDVMGGEVLHIDRDLGKATTIKVITNMLAFINLAGVREALMLAKKSEIDLKTAYEAIRLSSGNSFVHETEGQVILNGSYNILFSMELVRKDIGFALEIAEQNGVPVRLAELVADIYEEGIEKYGGQAESPQIAKLLEDEVGEELRAEGFPEKLTKGINV